MGLHNVHNVKKAVKLLTEKPNEQMRQGYVPRRRAYWLWYSRPPQFVTTGGPTLLVSGLLTV